MKALITGGAGFVGSHLTDTLLAQGAEVLVIDNYATGRRDNLSPHKNLRIVEGTIAENELVQKIFDEFKPEIVIHAAASYKDPANWREDVLSNVLGTINIVEASKKHNVKKIIYFQTALCYGLTPIEQPITITHPYFGGKSETGGSSYAISKTAGEQYVELSGIPFYSFRLANAYGPRNISGPLPTFYQRLTTNKPCFVSDTRRDFIFISDIISGIMKAILAAKDIPGYYHLSTGSDYSIKELFELTLSALNISLEKEVEVKPRNPDDVYTILIDPSKTTKNLGWKASVPLSQGIHETIQYYKEFGIQETFTHLKLDKK